MIYLDISLGVGTTKSWKYIKSKIDRPNIKDYIVDIQTVSKYFILTKIIIF
jgi:hypothetical protein